METSTGLCWVTSGSCRLILPSQKFSKVLKIKVVVLMRILNHKLCLTALVLLCLVPSTFAAKPSRDRHCDDDRGRKCQQVPEGGSALIYVLGAGVACLGAVISRSRMMKLNNA
jgi:hypothetical protein